MKYGIECPGLSLHLDGDKLIAVDSLDELDEDQFLDDFRELIQENSDIDYLWDDITDAISDFDVTPQGSFVYASADRAVFDIAMKNLEAQKQSFYIQLTEYSESGEEKKTRRISYFSIIENMLEMTCGDCGWDASISSYIEACLMEFVKQGCWRFGLQDSTGNIEENISDWPSPIQEGAQFMWKENGKELHPIIWYGLKNKTPDPHWILWNRDLENLSGLWFEEFEWEIIKNLTENADEGFLIWYTAECACQVPDMKCILNRCPVSVDFTNLNLDERNAEFEMFFYQQWKEVNESETLNQEIADGMM